MRKLYKKFLITKDQHEDQASYETKMQSLPYHEEEYWRKKDINSNKRQVTRDKKFSLEEILAGIKKDKDKSDI